MFSYCKLLLWTANIDNSVFFDTKDCDIKRKQFPYYTGQHVNIHKIKMWWSKECALLRFHSFTARKHWNIVNTPDKYKEYKILTEHHLKQRFLYVLLTLCILAATVIYNIKTCPELNWSTKTLCLKNKRRFTKQKIACMCNYIFLFHLEITEEKLLFFCFHKIFHRLKNKHLHKHS